MGRPSDAREQLIGAAKEMIYANSYEAVSVDELCAAAGVGEQMASLIEECGHFVAEEQPEELIQRLNAFFSEPER